MKVYANGRDIMRVLIPKNTEFPFQYKDNKGNPYKKLATVADN